MLNVKGIFSIFTVIFYISGSLDCATDFTGLKRASDVAENAIPLFCRTANNIAGTMAVGMTDASRVVGVDAARILGENGLKIVKELAPELTKASSNIGVEAAKHMGVEAAKVIAPYLGAAVAVYGVTQLYPIGTEIYERNYPTEEQKALQETSLEASKRRLSLLKSDREYRECLLNIMNKKIDAKINDQGRPAMCEEAASMLEMLGEQTEVDRMTEVFKIGNKNA